MYKNVGLESNLSDVLHCGLKKNKNNSIQMYTANLHLNSDFFSMIKLVCKILSFFIIYNYKFLLSLNPILTGLFESKFLWGGGGQLSPRNFAWMSRHM